MIELKDVVKTYRTGPVEVPALRGVNLFIGEGEMLALMGPSGSGKSTLMNIIGCLDIPTSGSYNLDGVDVGELKDWELAQLRNRKLGFVFQGFNLLARATALANVEVPLVYAGIAKRRVLAREALERVGLGPRARHHPAELSGGEQQRVAIARALVMKPRVILADEPTGNLDSQSSLEIMALLQRLHREEGITILVVTHEADIAACNQRLIQFRDGQVVGDKPLTQRVIA